ncbi:MAG: hypothetical protein IKX00_02290 [Bacilli bacterium]|nr:hypothetical protein [Bacilli bacterium]
MDKYYALYLDKHVDRKNKTQVENYRFIQPKFKMWNTDHIYLHIFSGIIMCKDAFFVGNLQNIPLIVRQDENGIYDAYYGEKLTIIPPIKLSKKEISCEYVQDVFTSLNSDCRSRESYKYSLAEYKLIIEEYITFISKLDEIHEDLKNTLFMHKTDSSQSLLVQSSMPRSENNNPSILVQSSMRNKDEKTRQRSK